MLSVLVWLNDGMKGQDQDQQKLNSRIKPKHCPRVSIGCKNDGSIEEIESGKESVPVLEGALECIKNLDGHQSPREMRIFFHSVCRVQDTSKQEDRATEEVEEKL